MLTAQSYSSEPTQTTLTIEGNTHKGYKTYFEYESAKVTRAFWQYAKTFAHLENHKSYYLVEIPPKDPAVEQPMILFGQPTAQGSTTFFTLAIDLSATEGESATYLKQVKNLLMEFKVDVYMKDFQSQINQLSKEAKKLSKAHQAALKKGKLFSEESAVILSRLQSIEKQIGQYRSQQIVLLSALKKVKG